MRIAANVLSRSLFFGLIVSLISSLISCSTSVSRPSLADRPLSTKAFEAYAPLKINEVALLGLRSGELFQPENVSNKEAITELMTKIFSNETSYEILNVANKALVDRAEKSIPASSPLEQQARSFGNKLNVQGVIFGVVTIKDAPGGSAFDSSESARVSINISLMDLRQSAVVWSASYFHTQKPLTENLFNIGQDKKSSAFRFKSSKELLEQGLRDVARALEKTRRKTRESGE